MQETKKPKIFISYSHEDEEWKDFIRTFLDNDLFDVWDDRNIDLGAKWYKDILSELNSCDIALLLISRSFLQSEFIKQKEIPIFLERCEKGEVKVVYFIISPCSWKHYNWIASLQGYPKDNTPLNKFQEQNHVKFKDCPSIQNEVQNLVEKILNSYKDNQKLQQINDKALEPLSDLINFLNRTYTIDKILEICQKYLDKNITLELEKYSNIKEIISHICNNSQFSCIVNDLNKDGSLDNYLRENPSNNCVEITANNSEPHITIIFREEDENVYEVTFKNKNLSHKKDGINSNRYNLKENKEELIKDIMKYVGTDNPTVDLVLPTTLMTEDINLWKVEFNSSLSTLAKVNIRDYNRYNMNEKLKQDKLVPIWDKLMTKEGLIVIDSEERLIQEVGNNTSKKGILAENILEKKHFDYLIKTEMGYIMVWKTNESLFDMQSLNESKLQQDYYALNNKPISMMYDNPNTYY